MTHPLTPNMQNIMQPFLRRLWRLESRTNKALFTLDHPSPLGLPPHEMINLQKFNTQSQAPRIKTGNEIEMQKPNGRNDEGRINLKQANTEDAKHSRLSARML